jgi:hypothetical protein
MQVVVSSIAATMDAPTTLRFEAGILASTTIPRPREALPERRRTVYYVCMIGMCGQAHMQRAQQ